MSSRPEHEVPRPSGDSPQENHAHWRRLLERQLDGSIAFDDRMALFDHLETCEECRAILEAEERLVTRLSELPRLVPPADLRARILSQAAREHAQADCLITGEHRFQEILREPEEVLEWDDDSEETDDSIGAGRSGLAKVLRGKRRTRWQRWSPVAATLFLFASSVTAFFTSDLSAIPPLNRMQSLAMGVARQVASLVQPQVPGGAGKTRNDSVAIAEAIDMPPAETRTFRPDLQVPQPADLASLHFTLLETAATTWRGLDESFKHLASAAQITLPGPAERETPVAAIVIRATDAGEAVTLEDDVVGEALRTTANAGGYSPDERPSVERGDQFVSAGRRYRCYTVNATSPWVLELERNLDPFRAGVDTPALLALREQGHGVAAAGQRVAYFAAPRQAIRHAVQSLEGTAVSAASRPTETLREVRVFVVE